MSQFNVTPNVNHLDNPTELDGTELIEIQQGENSDGTGDGVKITSAAIHALEMTPVNGVNAEALLTSSGAMAPATHAVSVLTSDATNQGEGDAVIIGSYVYTFRVTTLAAYDVKIGASAAASLDNLKKAINASGLGDGTDYHQGTVVHPEVVATTNADTTQEIQAKVPGTVPNLIQTTENGAHTSWADTTLGGGTGASVAGITTAAALLTIGTRVYTIVDELSETAADAIADQILHGVAAANMLDNVKLALLGVAPGTEFSTGTVVNADVTPTTNADTTQLIVAKLKGVSGHLIACVHSGANTAFDAAVLGTETAGVDGTPGVKGQIAYDADNIYICKGIALITDSLKWEKAAISAI